MIKIGDVFNSFTAIEPVRTGSSWNFRCKCGKIVEHRVKEVLIGRRKSCGCASFVFHGFGGTSEYKTWRGMLDRCKNPDNPTYINYGGRGITVCDEWLNCAKFVEDVGKNPDPATMTLDRIDGNGNYEPSNCRWASKREQDRNRHYIYVININDVWVTLYEYADHIGISSGLAIKRFKDVIKKVGDLTPEEYEMYTMERENILPPKYILTENQQCGEHLVSVSSRMGEDYKIHWTFRCTCGTTFEHDHYGVLNGNKTSCGCKNTSRGVGISQTPEYRVWTGMKYRCNNINGTDYSNYGGRGITVCERWNNDFYEFLKDMGTKPTPEHSLDRINVNGNYEPSNCRWATKDEQASNKTNTLLIEIDGVWKIASKMAKNLNISKKALLYRHRKNLNTKYIRDLLPTDKVEWD